MSLEFSEVEKTFVSHCPPLDAQETGIEDRRTEESQGETESSEHGETLAPGAHNSCIRPRQSTFQRGWGGADQHPSLVDPLLLGEEESVRGVVPLVD